MRTFTDPNNGNNGSGNSGNGTGETLEEALATIQEELTLLEMRIEDLTAALKDDEDEDEEE